MTNEPNHRGAREDARCKQSSTRSPFCFSFGFFFFVVAFGNFWNWKMPPTSLPIPFIVFYLFSPSCVGCARYAPVAKTRGAPPPEQGDDTRFRGGYPASCNPVRPSEPMYSTSRAFFNKGQMKKDFFDDSERAPDFRGSYGSRGANVRVPEESGSRASLSVFADEYSLGK